MSTDLVHSPFGSHCLIHDSFEPDMPGDYRACGECWHVYRSEWELLIAHNALALMWGEPLETDGSRVYSCPLCCHDF
jgi:hypothetical protein